MPGPAGVKSHPAIAALAALLGCGTPTVAARAVWIGEARDADGGRTLFSYAHGEITTSRVRPLAGPPLDPDTLGAPVVVELEPRGRGALIRGHDSGWLYELGDASGFLGGYVDLERRRALSLWLPPVDDAAGQASFTAAGDAIAWTRACPPAVELVPLAPGLPLDEEVHGAATTVAPLRRPFDAAKPARASCGAEGVAIASAADAPVIYALRSQPDAGGTAAARGTAIEALVYPARVGDEPLLRSRGRTTLPPGPQPLVMASLRCPDGDPACGVAAVDPDGAAVTVAVADADCRLLRWSADAPAPVCALAGDAPEVLTAGRLVAAISADHYVFRDALTLHRWDWRARELVSRPIVGDSSELIVRTTRDGRAVVAVTLRGPLLRVGVERVELLSVQQHRCPGPQVPVISPSGRFAAWTCVESEEDGEDGIAAGEVVRVSGAGMERFQGVPMWALAIDDDGDLLLHSRADQEFSYEEQVPPEPPRNLYVLAVDGELARVSSLEPDPEQMRGLGRGVVRWIDAQPL